MKYLSWIITVPLLAIAVIFAVQHREPVVLDLWPLPIQLQPPLYLVVLLSIFVGFLIGGIVTWLSQGRHRRRARERRFRIEDLERELAAARRKTEQLEAEAASRRQTEQQQQPARAALTTDGAVRQALPAARSGT